MTLRPISPAARSATARFRRQVQHSVPSKSNGSSGSAGDTARTSLPERLNESEEREIFRRYNAFRRELKLKPVNLTQFRRTRGKLEDWKRLSPAEKEQVRASWQQELDAAGVASVE